MLALDGDSAAISQEVGRVITNLLNAGQRSQDEAAARDALLLLRQGLLHVIDQGLVEGGLLIRHAHGDDLLRLLRQVIDDIRVRLEAAQDKRAGEQAQALRHNIAALALDGLGKVVAEEGS